MTVLHSLFLRDKNIKNIKTFVRSALDHISYSGLSREKDTVMKKNGLMNFSSCEKTFVNPPYNDLRMIRIEK